MIICLKISVTGNLIWLKKYGSLLTRGYWLKVHRDFTEEGNNTLCLSNMTSEGAPLIKRCITAVSIPSEQQQLKQFVNFADSWCLNCKKSDIAAEY